ncbi:MAG: class I SAM-dependent methyltransferase [Firmicutes bacterium]|nr:class I SAM-dependent methyltransferase [Bacillota bacterium]
MSENLITKTTVWAMEIVGRYVKPGDTVIDGTMGNGHDTLALAKLVGPEGTVIAFDIQPMALENTKALLEAEGMKEHPGIRLILDSNANVKNYVEPGEAGIAAILFNLGYLPGGDKTVTTTKEETLRAVSDAVELVKPGGLVAAVLYSGHEQGAEEKQALLDWAKELPAKAFHVAYISMWNQKKCPPEILLITRK